MAVLMMMSEGFNRPRMDMHMVFINIPVTKVARKQRAEREEAAQRKGDDYEAGQN